MNASGTLFSVVVPFRGGERHAEKAVESLWAQSFEDYEIVAVNNGRAEGVGRLLDTLVARSPRPMRVVAIPNTDAPVALNAAAALASSPFLAFLDDADAYHPDRLDAFARVVRKCDRFAWGFSGVDPIDERGTPLTETDLPHRSMRNAIQWSHAPLEAVRRLPYENTMVSNGNLVVRADLFRDHGGFRNLRFTYAWDLALRLLDAAPPFVLERPLYEYGARPGAADEGTLAGAGTRLVARESQLVISEHQDRIATRTRFAPLVAAPAGLVSTLDADDVRAVNVTLWALAKLRTIPPAYAAVRNAARLLQRSRRRWSRRG